MTGWKTILVAVLQGLVYLVGWEQLTEYVSPQIIALISTAVMLLLRFFTSTPVFKA